MDHEDVPVPDETGAFMRDEGGFQATDENNEVLNSMFYLGIIDILTPYNGCKKVEHRWKRLSDDKRKISPVSPQKYSNRFVDFLGAVTRGGDGGQSFKWARRLTYHAVVFGDSDSSTLYVYWIFPILCFSDYPLCIVLFYVSIAATLITLLRLDDTLVFSFWMISLTI